MPAPGAHTRARFLRSATTLGVVSLTAASLAVPAVAAKPAPPPVAQKSQDVTIDILSFNDFHGRIEQSGQAAGAGVLSCAIDTLRAENPEGTVVVSAGDNIGASTFTSAVADDQPTLDVLNEIGVDVATFGNHEFDKGRADVDGRVIPGSDFPYVSANIYDTATGERAYDAYHIEKIKGVEVAFVGAITEDMPALVSPAGIQGLEFRDISTEVNAVAAELSDGDRRNGEADVVVVVVHEGAPGTTVASAAGTEFGDLVANADENISAIISGHTHQLYSHNVDGTQVVQSSQYGEQLGNVEITLDRATGETTVTSRNVDLANVVGKNSAGQDVYSYYCPGDPEVQAIVDEAVAQAEIIGSVPVGEITDDFYRAKQLDGRENRGGESTIGNLVADAQLWAAQRTTDAEIAFMNPGGIRTDLLYAGVPGSTTNTDGVVTYKEAAEVQPFANTLVVMTLTGEQIYQVLEQQWQPAGASRPFLKLGVSENLTYTYNPTAPAGSRITEVLLNGEPIDPAGEYRVVANSFLASGGDNFTTFAQGTDRADTGQVDLQAMVDYLDAQEGPVAPDYAQRAVGVAGYAPGDTLTAGETVTLNFSSLVFSADEPKPTTLVGSLDGVSLGSWAIDPTIVSTTDEAGRATATFTVPSLEGYAPGDIVTLTFTAGETVVELDYTVA